MDIFDEMFSKNPKDKFLETLQNCNLGALEKTMEEFLNNHIAMIELLEKNNFTQSDIEQFKMENSLLLEERRNDFHIGLVTEILSKEG